MFQFLFLNQIENSRNESQKKGGVRQVRDAAMKINPSALQACGYGMILFPDNLRNDGQKRDQGKRKGPEYLDPVSKIRNDEG